jgi:iron complex transport system substrate-binding protein
MTRWTGAALVALLFAASPLRAETQPVRVATLLPYVADALVKMPAEKVMVVATVRRSMHDAPPSGVVDLGNPHSPSLEALAAAKPAIVVGDQNVHARLAENVGPLGAELILLDASDLDGTFDGLNQLGARVGAGAEMQRETAAAQTALASMALASPVETLALFGAAQRWLVVTERSWLGSLMDELGFVSVAKGAGGAERIPGYAEISDEQIATLAPALIVVVAHGDPRGLSATLEEKLGPNGAWHKTGASAGGDAHVLDPTLFTANPGLALPDAAKRLVELAPAQAAGTLPPVGASQ